MISKPRVCMLTVLNPALHARIFYKEATALARAGFQVVVVGQCGTDQDTEEQDNPRVIPIQPFGRKSWRRLFVPVRMVAKVIKLKPRVVHLHSPELLPYVPLLRVLTNAKLVYDMHEDYAANLQAGVGWPWPINGILAWLVRGTEKLMLRALAAVVYAEDAYNDILNAETKALVIRNKHDARMPNVLPPDKGRMLAGKLSFLCSGTLAESWGLWRSIHLYQQIRPMLVERGYDPILIIAGHAPDASVAKRLRTRYGQRSDIRLFGIEAPLSIGEINGWIAAVDFGMGLYENTPRLTKKVPTKFYTYRYYRRPILYTECPNWKAFFADAKAAIAVNELELSLKPEVITDKISILTKLKSTDNEPDTQYAFTADAERLVSLYRALTAEHQDENAAS